MKDTEIIGKVRPLYDVKEPDVLSKLSFDDVDMVKSEPPKLKGRYISAAVIYVAACLVIALVIPFIIAGVGNKKPDPTASVPSTDEVIDNGDTVYPAPEVNITEKVPREYHEVLRRYRSAVEAIVTGDVIVKDGKKYSPYEPVHEFSEGMYTAELAMEKPDEEKFGYALQDLNGDKIYELILLGKNDVLLEIYGIVDGKAVLVESFNPEYRGVIMAQGFIYTRTEASNSGYSCIGYMYDGNGGLTSLFEHGIYKKDGERCFYRAENGGERVDISQPDYLSLYKKYPEIPEFGCTENSLAYKLKYTSIAPPLRDKMMVAIERAIEQGRIEDRNYDKGRFGIIKINRKTGLYVIMADYVSFVHCDGEVYPIPSNVPVYTAGFAVACDLDKNGKEDLFIQGRWGSGVDGHSLIYFDANTKEFTELYADAFRWVNVVEETNDDGETMWSLYTGRRDIFVGTVGYENGEIVLDLIKEGTLVEIVEELESPSR